MESFIAGLHEFIENFAIITVAFLESLGIIVIVFGAIKSIIHFLYAFFKHKRYNIKISFGNALALGLEFKMGAEIIKTVIVRELDELWILSIIIILRALLAVLIHWEISAERKELLSLKPEEEFYFKNGHLGSVFKSNKEEKKDNIK